MDYERGYLLPNGCKNLIDVVNVAADVIKVDLVKQENGFMVRIKLSEPRMAGIGVMVDGCHLHILRTSSDGQVSRQNIMVVPPGYDISKAIATFVEDTLGIFIPKC